MKSILSELPDGLNFHYGFYGDDHRQINVRLESTWWVAYVGGEVIGGYDSKDAAEQAAIAYIEATRDDE